MNLYVVLDQLKDIDVSWKVASLHFLVIETKHSDELLEDNVVFGHYLLPDFPRKAHHFDNDIFQFHILNHC